jgi:hypothetical protein
MFLACNHQFIVIILLFHVHIIQPLHFIYYKRHHSHHNSHTYHHQQQFQQQHHHHHHHHHHHCSSSRRKNNKTILFMVTTDIEIIRDNIASSIDLFRDAYVYDSLNTAVAVGVSESFAGGISAVASRGIANVIGSYDD